MFRIQSFGLAILGCCSLAMAQDKPPTLAAPSTSAVPQAAPDASGSLNPSGPAKAALGVMLADDMTVNRIEPRSPAAQMGLQKGDRLTSLNGEPFSSADAFIDRVSEQPVGKDVEIGFDRKGQQMKKTGRLVGWSMLFAGNGMPGGAFWSNVLGSTAPTASRTNPTMNSGQVRPTRFLPGYGLGWVNNCTPMSAGSYYMNCDPGFCNYCFCW